MGKPKFLFGDIVVIEEKYIGIIVKTWENLTNDTVTYDIYDSTTNKIKMYYENEIDRYRVRHKYLDEEDMLYQNM